MPGQVRARVKQRTQARQVTGAIWFNAFFGSVNRQCVEQFRDGDYGKSPVDFVSEDDVKRAIQKGEKNLYQRQDHHHPGGA